MQTARGTKVGMACSKTRLGWALVGGGLPRTGVVRNLCAVFGGTGRRRRSLELGLRCLLPRRSSEGRLRGSEQPGMCLFSYRFTRADFFVAVSDARRLNSRARLLLLDDGGSVVRSILVYVYSITITNNIPSP